jgi:hypothetical protein
LVQDGRTIQRTKEKESNLMATAQELALNIGKRGQLRVAGTALTFEVEILDARNRYGNLDYKVRPTVGEGEAWHEATGVLIS